MTVISSYDQRLSGHKGGLRQYCNLIIQLTIPTGKKDISENISEDDYPAVHMQLDELYWECPSDTSENDTSLELSTARGVTIYTSPKLDASQNNTYMITNRNRHLMGVTTVWFRATRDVSENKTYTVEIRGH